MTRARLPSRPLQQLCYLFLPRECSQHVLGVLFLLSFSACAVHGDRDHASHGDALTHLGCSSRMLKRLYFGADTPAGEVTPDQWQSFLSEVITPEFPDGLTVVGGEGQWQRADEKIVRASAHVSSKSFTTDLLASVRRWRQS